MPINPENECKACENKNGQIQQDNLFANVILGISIFTALMVCVLLYISCLILDEKSSPPPVQFFLTTFLALLVFDAIIFQIAVNYFQWDSAHKQWLVMRDSNRQTRELFLIGERAYLGIESAAPSVTLAVGQYPEIRIHLRNAGKTPAWNLTLSLVMRHSVATPPAEMMKLDLRSEFDIHFKRSFIPAGSPETIQIRQDKVKIEDSRIWGLVTNLRIVFFYIIGEARYTDISQKERVLSIWLVYDPESQTFVACDSVADMWMWKGKDDWPSVDPPDKEKQERENPH